jgi:uncharacterized membrane-anchored protein
MKRKLLISFAACAVAALPLMPAVAANTLGETAGDTASMSMNLGYFVGTMLFGVVLVLLVCVIATLVAWHRSMGTAVGDWTADTGGLGYAGAALVFAVLLTALAAMYFWSSINHVMLFWAAFILTRPLGAAARARSAAALRGSHPGKAILLVRSRYGHLCVVAPATVTL